jgi:Flp pilus assembly protein TadG
MTVRFRRFRRAYRHGGRSRGQALVELAIVAPVLLLLLLAIFQMTFIFAAQVGLTNAARDVARAASGVEIATQANADVAAQEFFDRMVDPGGSLARNVSGYQPSGRVDAATPGNLATRGTRVCYYSFTDVSGNPAVTAYVEVRYAHPLFLPIIGNLIDGADGTSDGALELGAVEEFRVGNPALQSTDIPVKTSPRCNS